MVCLDDSKSDMASSTSFKCSAGSRNPFKIYFSSFITELLTSSLERISGYVSTLYINVHRI